MRVDRFDSISELGRESWGQLTEAANVFYSYDFLSSVERQPLSRPSTPVYLVARSRQGAPTAAMVLYLQETVDPFATDSSLGVQRMLVGHVWHCYDTLLPSAGGLDLHTVKKLCAAMREAADEAGAPIGGLVNVAWESPLAQQLAAAGLHGEETTPRYQLPIADGLTIDAHLSQVGRASRRTLRQYLRRAERAGAKISFDVGSELLDSDVLALCQATADKHAPGYYPPQELSALIAALGPDCRILRIDLDGTLLAVSICLLDGQRAHFWAGGCLYPAELNWSPQYVLFGAELEAGLTSGKAIVEFGRRNDEFKTRYKLRPQRLGRFMRS